MFKYFLVYYFIIVKTLTIKDKVYNELKLAKDKNESFSDLFERLVEKESKGISEFAGFLSVESAKDMKKEIYERRELSKKDAEREKRLKKW